MRKQSIFFYTQFFPGFIFFSYSSAEKKGIKRTELARRIIYQLHNENYDFVFTIFSHLIAEFPSQPEGYFIMANAYGTFVRYYRIRKCESEFNRMIDSIILIS